MYRAERRILLEQGVRTLIRHGYPRFVRLALRIITEKFGFGHRWSQVNTNSSVEPKTKKIKEEVRRTSIKKKK